MDYKSFFTEEKFLKREEHVIFTYWFETSLEPEDAAARLCQETSTVQWKRPGVDEDFRPLHAAKVISLEKISISKTPSFSSEFNVGDKFHRCRVRIAHPIRNFGTKIPNLLTVACGEGVFYCGGITSIKLLDIDFPDSFLNEFQGPQFGLSGIREILEVYDRPVFLGVVKPNIGLKPSDFGELAYQAWLGGLDAAKDDEMLSDVEWSPFSERARIVGRLRREAEGRTGKPKMFIANITDEVDRLVELHDIAVEAGANAVMVNGMTTGLSAVRMLRRHAAVPIVAHFVFITPSSRLPFFGVATEVFTKLQRLSGFDAIIMPGFGGRMMTTDDEIIGNIGECMKDFGKIKSSLPIPGGSDWAGSLLRTYKKIGNINFGFVPGRGVFAHPSGPEAGARSLHQAWDAIKSGIDLGEYAKGHDELREAIEMFGGK